LEKGGVAWPSGGQKKSRGGLGKAVTVAEHLLKFGEEKVCYGKKEGGEVWVWWIFGVGGCGE